MPKKETVERHPIENYFCVGSLVASGSRHASLSKQRQYWSKRKRPYRGNSVVIAASCFGRKQKGKEREKRCRFRGEREKGQGLDRPTGSGYQRGGVACRCQIPCSDLCSMMARTMATGVAAVGQTRLRHSSGLKVSLPSDLVVIARSGGSEGDMN